MELIPISEAAELVGASVATLRDYMREGRLMEYQKSGRLYVNKEELLAVFSKKRSSHRSTENPRIIAIANQKGGTGKTTTTTSLGYLLSQQGPTLLIDADPQGNMTQSFGISPDELESTLYEVLVNGRPIDQIIRTLPAPLSAISFIGSNLDLAQTTLQVSGRPTWATLLRNALAPVKSRFKFILIDCPPNLDALTVNALVAATEVIVPVEMGAFSLRGTSRLLDVIRDLKVLNPGLTAPHFLACRVRANTRLSAQIQKDLGTGFAEQVYATTIRESTIVGQAQYAKTPLALYAPTSGPAMDYAGLCAEVLNGTTRPQPAIIAQPPVIEEIEEIVQAVVEVKETPAPEKSPVAEKAPIPPQPKAEVETAVKSNGNSVRQEPNVAAPKPPMSKRAADPPARTPEVVVAPLKPGEVLTTRVLRNEATTPEIKATAEAAPMPVSEKPAVTAAEPKAPVIEIAAAALTEKKPQPAAKNPVTAIETATEPILEVAVVAVKEETPLPVREMVAVAAASEPAKPAARMNTAPEVAPAPAKPEVTPIALARPTETTVAKPQAVMAASGKFTKIVK